MNVVNSGSLVRFGLMPSKHRKISVGADNKLQVPDHVVIPAIEGDGIGEEIMHQAQRAVDTAVKLSYGNTRSIRWKPLEAGEKALAQGKSLLPQETLDTIREHYVAVKGPLNTPIGRGFQSANVQLRKLFNLFANVRPIKNLPGVETPLAQKNIDVVIFRENTEDVYRGIEYEKGSEKANKLRDFLKREFGEEIPADSGIGIKPMSETASKRIVAKAIQYALDQGYPSVTIVHKGNIQKFTEGAFLQWGREVAHEKFGDKVILQEDFWQDYGGDYARLPKGKIVLRDRIADAMFQDVIQNPTSHHVVVTPNLNGDYLSDAYAATVGGLGLARGANIGDTHALFEAVHGSAPDIAGQNKANPTALILSMVMMLNHLGWGEAAQRMIDGVNETLRRQQMTGDLARHIPGVRPLGTDQFTDALIDNMRQAAASRPDGSAA